MTGGPARSQISVVTKIATRQRRVREKTFIGNLLTDYYYVDDMPLGERNPKWLQDDYVKFIRFAQWRIERTGHGILGFITNHGYLDNPTFRGMRQSLMQSFSDIYVYDLHGSYKKHEVAPDGGEDENVFDIQQGVAILFAVKTAGHAGFGRVYHSDLWGPRDHKYSVLSDENVDTTNWTQLTPSKPNYYFIPQDADLTSEYERGWKLTVAMPINVLGFQTHRDDFAVSFDEEEMRRRIGQLRGSALSDEEIRERFKLRDNRDWKLAAARAELRKDKNWQASLVKCLYRPFDWRYCYFSTVTMDYPRRELLSHVVHRENCVLLASRQLAVEGFRHALCSAWVPESCVVSLRTKEQNYAFPLYLYPDDRGGLFEQHRHANFADNFVAELTTNVNLSWVGDGRGDLRHNIGPEDVFDYHCCPRQDAPRNRATENRWLVGRSWAIPG